MNILSIIPVSDGLVRKTSLEVASYAAYLAKESGGQLTALVVGKAPAEELDRLATHGLSQIWHATGEWTNLLDHHSWVPALAEAAAEVQADCLVLPDNAYGKALAPALAIRLDAAFVPGVDGIPMEAHPYRFKRSSFSGKAAAEVSPVTARIILTLSPNSFGVHENPQTPEVRSWEPSESRPARIRLVERRKPEGKMLMSEADIIVSGGRGMKGPEHWGPLEALAETLGAATACSRPVSDEGWRGHEEHVGQTGKVVAPNLYIACGISGAVQHLAGISASKVLVAINKDPEAPIFTAADYGIIGDVHQILPRLNEAFKAVME